MESFVQILGKYSDRFNQDLERFFPVEEDVSHIAFKAMHYSITNGGKRLRPFLLSKSSELFGVGYEKSLPVAVSLEMVHSYSLVHDDLPAMDNDDFRRGKPTCHKQFNEAIAILAGDGLLTYAFEILSEAQILDNKKVLLTNLLAKLAGARQGMIAGQVLDLFANDASSIEQKEELVRKTQALKTGCLLKYPCLAGAILGDASQKEKDILVNYANNVGLSFQITDDILDVIGDEKTVGKTLKKDEKQNKLNFVSIYGVEKARRIAQDLIEESIDIIDYFGDKALELKLLSSYILDRKY